MAKKTFEQALKQLELIVQSLEAGNIPLEKAINKFEEGMALSKFCSSKLDEADKKVTLLMQDNNGELTEKPFKQE